MTNKINKVIHNGTEFEFESVNWWVTSVNGQTGDVTWLTTHSTIQVTLSSSWWSNNTQTVTATWVTSNNTVIVSPAPTSITDYTWSKIYCSAQWTDSLTFACDSTPSNSITVNVVILK